MSLSPYEPVPAWPHDMETRNHWISAALLGVCLLALVAAQLTPWAVHRQDFSTPGFSGFGMSTPGQSGTRIWTASLWEAEFDYEGTGGTAHEDEGWYSSSWGEDGEMEPGVVAMRVAIPLTLLALVTALPATLVILADFRLLSAVLSAGTLVLGSAGAVIAAVGTNQYFDGNFEIDPTWHVGIYLSVLGLLCAAAGGVMALLPSPGLGLVERVRAAFTQ